MGERADEVRRRQQDMHPVDRDAAAHQEQRDPDALRSDIEQTRADMSETIDTIQERLSPHTLATQARATAYDATIGRTQQAARGAGSSLVDTVKQHPIPAALAGLSMGYLVLQRARGAPSTQLRDQPAAAPYYQTYETYDQPGATTGSTHGRAGQIAHQTRAQASQYGQEARAQVQQYRDQARQQASAATGWFQRTLQENPLALGAGTLILGLAVGLAVPETRKEHALMGEARDSLLQQAQASAQDTVQRAQRVAEEATDTAKQEAKQEGLPG